MQPVNTNSTRASCFMRPRYRALYPTRDYLTLTVTACHGRTRDECHLSFALAAHEVQPLRLAAARRRSRGMPLAVRLGGATCLAPMYRDPPVRRRAPSRSGAGDSTSAETTREGG